MAHWGAIPPVIGKSSKRSHADRVDWGFGLISIPSPSR